MAFLGVYNIGGIGSKKDKRISHNNSMVFRIRGQGGKEC